MGASEQIQKRLPPNRHMTVRIPKGMTDVIKEFLNTEQAAKMGFHSRADVVTAAVRRLLDESGYYDALEREE